MPCRKRSSCCKVEWFLRKPNCLGEIDLETKSIIELYTILSSTFEIVQSSEMGR